MSSVPFITRVAAHSAKDILARDRARAQKILQGINPHGPVAFHEARRRRHGHHHHHHGHHAGGGAAASDPSSGGSTGTGGTSGGAPTSTPGGGVDVTDAGVTYTASVGVGNPPTQYTLLIDTGSSNTWVGADKQYVKTSTSKSTGKQVVGLHQVLMNSRDFLLTISFPERQLWLWLVLGHRVYVHRLSWPCNVDILIRYVLVDTDQVTLSDSLVIQNQSIGVASTAQGFQGVDGILGIGPVDLTQGTVSGTSSVPTVTDNLFAQGTISNDSIGIFYQPTTQSGEQNGELTFGGIDTSKYASFRFISSSQVQILTAFLNCTGSRVMSPTFRSPLPHRRRTTGELTRT